MTQAEVKRRIKGFGRELTVKITDGEWRVAYAIPAIQMLRDCSYAEAREANEASAYYTTDAGDAIATAAFMHLNYVNNPASLKGN